MIGTVFVDNAVMNDGRIFFSSAATGGRNGRKNQANPKSSSTQGDYGIPLAQCPNIGSVRNQFKRSSKTSTTTCLGWPPSKHFALM